MRGLLSFFGGLQTDTIQRKFPFSNKKSTSAIALSLFHFTTSSFHFPLVQFEVHLLAAVDLLFRTRQLQLSSIFF